MGDKTPDYGPLEIERTARLVEAARQGKDAYNDEFERVFPRKTLSDGYTDLAFGKLAAVVTYLEMLAPAPLPEGASTFDVRRVEKPDLCWYRELFRRVGEDWLWFSRLRMTDEELAAILHHAGVEVYALSAGGRDEGLLELDRRSPPDVELAFLGVTTAVLQRGAGRALMRVALEQAWRAGTKRFWVHTCSLDHPRALSFYIKAGFRPYKRAVEVFDDPRLTGDLPRTAARHIPLIA
ncbi:MAG: GNAT family N-acetyltransferase [Bryobacteraceae bacterium]|nr:GNAT family N-acetyltransferase [Bryobacteraceae bacterium]